MHTLIIAQNDKKLRKKAAFKKADLHILKIKGKKASYVLRTEFTPPSDPRVLGGVLAGSPNRIKNLIIAYAQHVNAKYPISDELKFQVIFSFHQTTTKVVANIIKSMRLLSSDRRWIELPTKIKKAVSVKVWLLSCESGAYMTTTAEMKQRNLTFAKYESQSQTMLDHADVAFTTIFIRTIFKPTIYTFSTGDPETGGTVIDPWNVSFKKLPGRFTADYGWDYLPTPAGQNELLFRQGENTSGKIYKYHDFTTTSTNLAAGATMNITGLPTP